MESPEIAFRVNLEQVGLLDARMREIIRIAYHETDQSTARKMVKMCSGWANRLRKQNSRLLYRER